MGTSWIRARSEKLLIECADRRLDCPSHFSHNYLVSMNKFLRVANNALGLGRGRGREPLSISVCVERRREGERSFDFWTNTQWNVIFCSGKKRGALINGGHNDSHLRLNHGAELNTHSSLSLLRNIIHTLATFHRAREAYY